MSERLNGKHSFSRRTQGSELRGARPVPAFDFAYRQEQSRVDQAKRLEWVRRQKQLAHERQEAELGLGNRELPAFKHKAELVDAIEHNKAVIVGGETGSGKSTQLPQYLYEAGFDMTIMLVPRRVIADGLGERIREELESQIEDFNGEETVGIIHGERVERHENNKILVMTPNTFIKMQNDLREKFGDRKLAVVADEIHEANLFTEIAVGVAALSVEQQENWHLIAASATHNAATLQKPFERLNGGFVPSVEIKGRPFNVELQEQPELTPMQAYARDGHAHEKAMIFTSGKKELEYAIQETRKALGNEAENVVFRVLHGELTEVELSHINDPVPEGRRLVIVSSPAGMSGITIPGVTYVATDGTINRAELDDDNAEGLRRHYLSKAGVIQEIGRAGRDVPGGIGVLCAPIQAEKEGAKKREETSKEDRPKGMEFIPFEAREEHEPPEIYSTNLGRVVLSVAAAGYKFSELNEFIPHRVQQLDIINAEESLMRLGALDDDGKATEIGEGMDQFPVTPELARGLFEASRPGKTLQHMARAAFIASAVDVGGLQDFRASEEVVKTRKQIIRPTTDDDFIAQLDLMTKLYERTDRTDGEGDFSHGYHFIERHGLHPKRVERVRKTTRKILSVMGIRPENLIVTAPLPDEERELRDDFTAGFIDFVFQEVGKAPRSHATLYRNIHGGSESTVRTISDRSEAKIKDGQLVAGIPRWYEKGERKDGTPIKHDIIDRVFKVDANVVGRHAMQNGLIQGVFYDARMDGDRVVDFEQGMFGSILVGAPSKRPAAESISERSQELLVDYAVKHPGRVQQSLRALATELEGFRERTPADILAQLRKPGAPSDVTQAGVTEMIRYVAKTSTAGHEVEEKLRALLYSTNITLGKFYDSESVRMLIEMSPQSLKIGGDYARVLYKEGQPYITNISRKNLATVTGPIYLPDGREVLYQRQARGGGKEQVSFGS